MEHIYIAMVDTPGIFAAVIRRFLRQRYIHVVLGMDAGLEEAYSFGRRNPRVPWFAGFEREDKHKILRAFPTAVYRVCELECSAAQKEAIRERLRQDYKRRFRYHYAVPGLPFIVLGRPFYLKDQYTCSSYIARLLEEYKIRIAEKHFSLVTPKDFCLYPYKRVLYEGSLAGFVKARETELQTDPAQERVPVPVLQTESTGKEKEMQRRLREMYGKGTPERAVAYGS